MKLKKKILILCSICLVILIGAIITDRYMANAYLKEISYNDAIKKIENKETFILLVSQTTCSHCKDYKPVFKKVLKDNKITAYYIEFDLLSDDEKKEFTKHINFDSTPTTVFLKSGEETTTATRIVGAREEEYIIGKLKSNGYIK